MSTPVTQSILIEIRGKSISTLGVILVFKEISERDFMSEAKGFKRTSLKVRACGSKDTKISLT